MTRRFAAFFCLILLGALVLRVPQLGRRPVHGDEAVNTIKFRDLWERGLYRYDPNEFHGPTLAYSTLFSAICQRPRSFADFSIAAFRIVPVVFGIGLLLLLPLFRDGLDRSEMLAAALWTALSPAMVFYSRYYIHEMLLVFFTLLFLAAGWRYVRRPALSWAILAGAAFGFMQATKETFVFSAVALAVAIGLVMGWDRWQSGKRVGDRLRVRPGDVAAAVAAAVIVSVTLFSSFYRNAQGPLDSIRTYIPWLSRAAGNTVHAHPWYFYWRRLLFFHVPGGPVWTEGLILILGGIGLAAARPGAVPTRRIWFLRVIALYTVILAGIYSVLTYKTPWCLLGFWDGVILLAGVGTMVLWRRARRGWIKAAVALALATGAGHLGWEAWRASFREPASRSNPYVYAHTSPDITNLVQRVEALASVASSGHHTVVKVMAPGGDYWPLPWYLRRFDRVGWWSRIPSDPWAPIMIVSSSFDAKLDERSNKKYLMTGYFQLRPEVFLELYVDIDLWREYVHSRPAAPGG